ncbi:MAG: GNAT family N-acetyltransferase [Oscillospiraceae bacterium]|nr:GNAT family N-acetyltransferase [Oscillospiraceae bacterium]
MIIKKANEEEIPELVDLRIAYVEEDYGGLSEDTRQKLISVLPKYFEKHLNRDIFVYTAKDSAIVSCAFLVITERPANPSFITGRMGTVYNVYTLPNYRRKGLAKRVMQELLFDAEKIGLDFVDLKATSDGYHLYDTLGFKETVSEYTYMKKILSN